MNQLTSIFLAIGLILITWNTLLHFQLWQMKKKLRAFFQGKQGADLEGVLFEQIKRLRQSEGQLKELFQANKKLSQMAEQGIQKVGLIRFNPFKDTGGDQSFSIALLDAQDNGLVISSLYTPQGSRVYSKPIVAGASKYNLSQEELKAIKQARQNYHG